MDETGQVGLSDADVPADLVERDPPLGDQPADEPFGGVQVLGSLLDRVQPVHRAPPASVGMGQVTAAGVAGAAHLREPFDAVRHDIHAVYNAAKGPRTITYGGLAAPAGPPSSLQGL